ncbi:MAG TPA: hypothetical protein VFT76_04045 [Actinomycetota bacterium]|nr:hypothetical protein [Actinomycetota bacterium]
MLRVVLVKDGTGGDYWWVECGACDTTLQGPHYPRRCVTLDA